MIAPKHPNSSTEKAIGDWWTSQCETITTHQPSEEKTKKLLATFFHYLAPNAHISPAWLYVPRTADTAAAVLLRKTAQLTFV